MTGWRNLGMPFEASESNGNVLKTLDGQRALEAYGSFGHQDSDEALRVVSNIFHDVLAETHSRSTTAV